MRGKHLPNAGLNLWPWFIPAHAGKTPTSPLPTNGPPAHPRACGENGYRVSMFRLGMGSSPRVRGKPIKVTIETFHHGLIPACAGKTRAFNLHFLTGWVHPCVCGENLVEIIQICDSSGSSPRVRGNLASIVITPVDVRSSPRVRGKRQFEVWRWPVGGIIPAHAGKTREKPRTARPRRAHPRACGENRSVPSLPLPSSGSSPHVRGKPNNLLPTFPRVRLIPACAGKTTEKPCGSTSR